MAQTVAICVICGLDIELDCEGSKKPDTNGEIIGWNLACRTGDSGGPDAGVHDRAAAS
jgi:hypothetical protein